LNHEGVRIFYVRGTFIVYLMNLSICLMLAHKDVAKAVQQWWDDERCWSALFRKCASML